MKFKKSSQIALGILSAAAMMSCSDDNSSENEQTPACTSNAQCASRPDGKTQCDLTSGVCVAPDQCAPNEQCGGPNTAPGTDQTPGVLKCNENQEWSAKYQTCVYPINSQADYEGYVTTWNTNGKDAFPGIGDEDPVFLLKTDIKLEEGSMWGTLSNPFEAVFYGDNQTIALYGERQKADQGLFGYTSYAEIRDVKINLIKASTSVKSKAYAFIAAVAKHTHFDNIEVTGYWKLDDTGYGMFKEVSDSVLENININLDMEIGKDIYSSVIDNTFYYNVSPFLKNSTDSVYRNISLNGTIHLDNNYNVSPGYAGLAFSTTNDRWENIKINFELRSEALENTYCFAYVLFKNMAQNTVVDRVNISKMAVSKTGRTAFSLISNTKSCTSCVISNLQDNTNYSNAGNTYFIEDSKASGLSMYNVLINSNYDKNNDSEPPARAINVLIQNQNKTKQDFGNNSRPYPYVYDKADIETAKVTVDVLNNNLKPEIIGEGSYLPWRQDSKGRFYLKFDESADEGSNETADPTKCSEKQEWSDKYKTCVYPINTQADYEGYVTTWNTNGKDAFPGIGDEDPVFLLKTDIKLEEGSMWGTLSNPFEAVFYGDNQTIALYGERQKADQGLFGYTSYAEIRDVKINLIKASTSVKSKAYAFIAAVAKHTHFDNIEVTGYWKLDDTGYGMFKEVSDSVLENININLDMEIGKDIYSSVIDNTFYYNVSPFLKNSTDSVYRNISLNGTIHLDNNYNVSPGYAGLAFSTTNDRWENIKINFELRSEALENTYCFAYVLFKNMAQNTVVDRVNISKMAVSKTGRTAFSLISNTKSCTSCVISNLQDNTNYSNAGNTYFIEDSKASGLSMYNVLINSNYDKNNDSEPPARAINILIPNQNKTKWDFGNESIPYPYVYDKTDIAAGKVTVNLLNNNLKAGIVKSGSYLPWAQDNKGRFYLKFNAQDSEIRVIP